MLNQVVHIVSTAPLKVKVVPVGNKRIGMNWCPVSGGVVPSALHFCRPDDNAADWKSDYFASWLEHYVSRSVFPAAKFRGNTSSTLPFFKFIV